MGVCLILEVIKKNLKINYLITMINLDLKFFILTIFQSAEGKGE